MKIEIQKHIKGCGIACLATVVGTSYDELAAEWLKHGDFDNGIFPDELHRFLWHMNYFVLRKYRQFADFPSIEWPPKPFAPIHICEVVLKDSNMPHYIIMDKDGQLFDPMDGNQKQWDDFKNLNRVEGIIK